MNGHYCGRTSEKTNANKDGTSVWSETITCEYKPLINGGYSYKFEVKDNDSWSRDDDMGCVRTPSHKKFSKYFYSDDYLASDKSECKKSKLAHGVPVLRS